MNNVSTTGQVNKVHSKLQTAKMWLIYLPLAASLSLTALPPLTAMADTSKGKIADITDANRREEKETPEDRKDKDTLASNLAMLGNTQKIDNGKIVDGKIYSSTDDTKVIGYVDANDNDLYHYYAADGTTIARSVKFNADDSYTETIINADGTSAATSYTKDHKANGTVNYDAEGKEIAATDEQPVSKDEEAAKNAEVAAYKTVDEQGNVVDEDGKVIGTVSHENETIKDDNTILDADGKEVGFTDENGNHYYGADSEVAYTIKYSADDSYEVAVYNKDGGSTVGKFDKDGAELETKRYDADGKEMAQGEAQASDMIEISIDSKWARSNVIDSDGDWVASSAFGAVLKYVNKNSPEDTDAITLDDIKTKPVLLDDIKTKPVLRALVAKTATDAFQRTDWGEMRQLPVGAAGEITPEEVDAIIAQNSSEEAGEPVTLEFEKPAPTRSHRNTGNGNGNRHSQSSTSGYTQDEVDALVEQAKEDGKVAGREEQAKLDQEKLGKWLQEHNIKVDKQGNPSMSSTQGIPLGWGIGGAALAIGATAYAVSKAKNRRIRELERDIRELRDQIAHAEAH